jgi:hypothetical protein
MVGPIRRSAGICWGIRPQRRAFEASRDDQRRIIDEQQARILELEAREAARTVPVDVR